LCILPMSSAGQEREKKANEWSSAPWKWAEIENVINMSATRNES
jgi:hypothetical protein